MSPPQKLHPRSRPALPRGKIRGKHPLPPPWRARPRSPSRGDWPGSRRLIPLELVFLGGRIMAMGCQGRMDSLGRVVCITARVEGFHG